MAWTSWTVFAKEWVDALRDRRTLAVVLLSSVLMGPLVLIALSGLVASFESRAERREVVLDGIEHAPTLVNYLQRQGFAVKPAPEGFEEKLRRSELGDPVLVVPKDFEASAARGGRAGARAGERQRQQAQRGRQRAAAAAGGRFQPRARHAGAGACAACRAKLLEPVRLGERDLANPQTRGTQITGMLPFFVLMAVLYGALNAALDTTAGERERGSLEPLLMNPASPLSLVLGKWAAVSAVALLIAVLSCFSFIPAQWLLRSDTLAALFQFGWREALWFVAIIAPFAAALSALLMAVAIRCRSCQGGAGEFRSGDPGGVAAAAGGPAQPRWRGALAPVGAGTGAEHADDACAQGRSPGPRAGGGDAGGVRRAGARRRGLRRPGAAPRRGALSQGSASGIMAA